MHDGVHGCGGSDVRHAHGNGLRDYVCAHGDARVLRDGDVLHVQILR